MRRIASVLVAACVVLGAAAPSQAVTHRRDVVSISVTPAPRVPRGLATPLTVTAVLRNGSRVDITRRVRWTSSLPLVQLSRRGRSVEWVTGRSAGQSVVTAAWGSLRASTTVTVTDATLVAVSVTPAPLVVAVGHTQVLTALGTFSDGSTIDITRASVWSSSNPDILTVVGRRALGIADGSALLVVVSRAIVGTASVTVGAG